MNRQDRKDRIKQGDSLIDKAQVHLERGEKEKERMKETQRSSWGKGGVKEITTYMQNV